jgi:hypothetical protein
MKLRNVSKWAPAFLALALVVAGCEGVTTPEVTVNNGGGGLLADAGVFVGDVVPGAGVPVVTIDAATYTVVDVNGSATLNQTTQRNAILEDLFNKYDELYLAGGVVSLPIEVNVPAGKTLYLGAGTNVTHFVVGGKPSQLTEESDWTVWLAAGVDKGSSGDGKLVVLDGATITGNGNVAGVLYVNTDGKVDGNIAGDGAVIVNGYVIGDIDVKGDVYVGPVNGFWASNRVNGQVDGEIISEGKVLVRGFVDDDVSAVFGVEVINGDVDGNVLSFLGDVKVKEDWSPGDGISGTITALSGNVTLISGTTGQITANVGYIEVLGGTASGAHALQGYVAVSGTGNVTTGGIVAATTVTVEGTGATISGSFTSVPVDGGPVSGSGIWAGVSVDVRDDRAVSGSVVAETSYANVVGTVSSSITAGTNVDLIGSAGYNVTSVTGYVKIGTNTDYSSVGYKVIVGGSGTSEIHGTVGTTFGNSNSSYHGSNLTGLYVAGAGNVKLFAGSEIVGPVENEGTFALDGTVILYDGNGYAYGPNITTGSDDATLETLGGTLTIGSTGIVWAGNIFDIIASGQPAHFIDVVRYNASNTNDKSGNQLIRTVGDIIVVNGASLYTVDPIEPELIANVKALAASANIHTHVTDNSVSDVPATNWGTFDVGAKNYVTLTNNLIHDNGLTVRGTIVSAPPIKIASGKTLVIDGGEILPITGYDLGDATYTATSTQVTFDASDIILAATGYLAVGTGGLRLESTSGAVTYSLSGATLGNSGITLSGSLTNTGSGRITVTANGGITLDGGGLTIAGPLAGINNLAPVWIGKAYDWNNRNAAISGIGSLTGGVANITSSSFTPVSDNSTNAPTTPTSITDPTISGYDVTINSASRLYYAFTDNEVGATRPY